MFPLKFYGMLLYSIPSTVLYCMTIFMVKKFAKDFSNTFLKLYVVFFVVNMITFTNSFITIRLPQNTCANCSLAFIFEMHTLNNRSWFPLNFFYSIHFSMGYIQFLMIFLTSFNRFSMIFWSTVYENYWNKFFFFIISTVIIIPFLITSPAFLADTYYVYTESLGCYTVGSSMNREQIYNPLLVCLAVITIITAVINIASFYQLSCMTVKISIAERNLVFMSSSLFMVQLIADVNTTFNRFAINDSNRTFLISRIATTLLPYVSDGLTFIHPWMFLLFSTRARRRFFSMYIPGYTGIFSVNTSIQLVSQSQDNFSRRSQSNNRF